MISLKDKSLEDLDSMRKQRALTISRSLGLEGSQRVTTQAEKVKINYKYN